MESNETSDIGGMLQKFWEIETRMSKKDEYCPYDREALKFTEESLLNLADDMSNINALENETRNLPDNYETAYKQLVHTEKDYCNINSWRRHTHKLLRITWREDIFQKSMKMIQEGDDTYHIFPL